MKTEKLERKLANQIKAGLAKACSATETATVREVLRQRRLERLVSRYTDLALIEREFMDVVDMSIDWNNLRPMLCWTESPQELRIWDYTRNVVSSAPDAGYYGRRMKFHFIDKDSGRWLGIGCLASPLGHAKPRDDQLGWDMMTKYHSLAKVLNLQVCVSIQPFGILCGGKLMFVAALSNEVRNVYKKKYGDDLLAIETTSLFGKSSQYNRVREYEYLGLTKGHGTLHISEDLWSLMRQYLALRPDISAGYAAMKMRLLDHVARDLGISSYVSNHQQGRGYYFGVTATNAKDILCGDAASPAFIDRPMAQLTDLWKERWYLMRLPKKRKEVEEFNASTYALNANVPEEMRGPRQLWLL